ncbi:Aha1 N domain-containing protein [Citrus sinensis]|uniref:Aha1 N domain-containing protein n=3 Tax=Citrus TaxID=2706 RepID=A0ACB8P5M4_CITSI|nr:Aha1 N domain-containing protein [Citrus sinensis]
MENGGGVVSAASEKQEQQEASYTYWVREATADAAPLPVPKMLSPDDILSNKSQPATLGSVWNRLDPTFRSECTVEAGTWEEKSLNKWASDRIKELLTSVGSVEFSGGKAEITEVSNCVGDAFLVTVRNKKRVGYNYELTLKVRGEWNIREEKKMVKGHIDIPEFSFGELDDLQMQVRISEEKDLSKEDKLQISQDLKMFLQPVREKLLLFEQELKDR